MPIFAFKFSRSEVQPWIRLSGYWGDPNRTCKRSLHKCALRGKHYYTYSTLNAYSSALMLGMVSQDDGIGLMSVTETLDSKIKAQEEKLKQLKAQRQAALARERAKDKEQARKDDTRRKILIGSCMLKITEEDEQARAKLIAQMDKYLTDERDRKLFNL